MKALDPAFDAHILSGATTLCWCWRLTRADGVRLGFTDHDRALIFDGTTFEASAGFTASDIKESIGLSVDNLDVTGALSSQALDEHDLARGLYDDARVEIFRVNWQAVAERVLMRSGSLGEVRRSGLAFTAEVRGLAHYLQQPMGRLYQLTCDADLGDARCKVNLSSPSYRGTATISAVSGPRAFTVTGITSFAHDFFTRGLAVVASGAALASRSEIKRHSKIGGVVTMELWTAQAVMPTVGDTLTVTAGCDKRIATCAARFSNTVNFRGFPTMPGNDIVTKIARRS
ncbi:MAG: DUF2163 domain-containing protein [Hyphomicrobium sp.]